MVYHLISQYAILQQFASITTKRREIKYFLLTYGKSRCILIVQFELARRNAVNHNGGERRKMYIHEAIKKAQERNAAGQSWGLRRADWGKDYLSFGQLLQPNGGHDTCGYLILHESYQGI